MRDESAAQVVIVLYGTTVGQPDLPALVPTTGSGGGVGDRPADHNEADLAIESCCEGVFGFYVSSPVRPLRCC